MSLKRYPVLFAFLSTHFSNSDIDTDDTTLRALAAETPIDRKTQVIDQMRLAVKDQDLSLEEIGAEANRWFGELQEAHLWLQKILEVLESQGGSQRVSVNDSNGMALSEGDSVFVIKDLKVKGGSSDLKRGTLIKKIHLIDDPELVECRVAGSTLVLKTCFLKKA